MTTKAPFTRTEPVYVIRIGMRIGSVYTWAVKPDQVNTCKRVSGLQAELCNHLRCSSIGVCREEAKEHWRSCSATESNVIR